MKKMILMALIALLGTKVTAAELSDSASKFSTLFMLKTIIEQTAVNTAEVLEKNQASAEYYSSLRFYQLSEKTKVGRLNCAEVKSVSVATGIMISTLLESSAESLKQIPEINNQETLLELSKITDYFHAMTAANEACLNPKQSLEHVVRANQLIGEVNNYLEKIKNELPL